MTEVPTPAPPAPDPEPEPTPTPEEENRIPRERLNQEARRRKDAEKRVAELQAALEERENAGLPELERMKKDFERAQKRAEDAEQRAEAAEKERERGRKERWVTAAAQSQNFADPSDASAFLNLDDIEDEKDAERAVKRLAGSKKHLVKSDGPVLPGRVLRDGQRENGDRPASSIQPMAEAEMLAEGLKQFASRR